MGQTSQQFITKIISNPKPFSLGVVLTRFEYIFGMPRPVLYILSLMACGIAVYSFCCYMFFNKNWRPFLKFIAIVNSLYCCVTFVLIFYLWEKLTTLGVGYFLLEIVVIVTLVTIELKAVNNRT